MIKPETLQLLTNGLLQGFGGKTDFGEVKRGAFTGKSSVLPDGLYIDQWFTGESSGGGQELARTSDGQGVTRLYAGGTLLPEKLAELGLDEKTVLGQLVGFIREAGVQTRLLTDYQAKTGDWSYEYRLIQKLEEFDLTVALETISFKGQKVFAHAFLISPIG